MTDFTKLRICLLTDQDLNGGLPLPDDDWPCDPRPYLPEADWTVLTLDKADAVPAVMEAARRGFDVYFNLCDGAWDEARPGIEVVQTLERLGLAFTGGHSGFYEPTREAMKRVCHAAGIAAPNAVEVHGEADIERAIAELRFPLIVKHPSSYASVGLIADSRVDSIDGLHTQVDRMRRLHHGALIEEFIEGDEYTVLVGENPHDAAAPIAYRPLVYRFPPGESFKHEDLKWIDYDGLEASPVADSLLDERLRREATRFFHLLDGSGYARCDIRTDPDGRPFMLEINPNCGLFYPPTDPSSADLILQTDPEGHTGFVRTVVDAALARHDLRRPSWTVRRRNGRGYGIYATRSLREGETVLSLEGRSHELVRRDAIAAVADPDERRRRLQGSWPLTREIWAAWPRDPMGWRPLNHSCEPTAWISSLDVRARTALAPGDEITIDYATLYDEILPDFRCDCETPGCRKIVRGSDWKGPIVTRYGTYVSDYIRTRRCGEER